MLLTISTSHKPASDLGYLLHKHPNKFQSVDLSIGKAHIFYPESNEDTSQIALLLDIDPIDMVRGNRNFSGKGFALGQYVNDRPYVASSFMSVAIAKAFSTALNGRCKDKPEMVNTPMPIEVKISVLPTAKGGEILIRSLFEPLGYTVNVERHILDEKFTQWGESKYYTLSLGHTICIKDLLAHLYVLIPVLDNDKHYYVSKNEIDKLLKKGEGWLDTHPQRDQIVNRYLMNFRSLTRQALEHFDTEENETEETKAVKKKKESLHQQRLKTVVTQLIETKAKSVLDLGCGEGKLIKLLMKHQQFEKITGMDVSYNELLKAKERLYWHELSPKQKERIKLFQGALNYRDSRLEGYDAAALVEVIEHLEEDRLSALQRVVFECAKPQHVIVTTPNAEYNILYESLEAGTMRHNDHRFEWTRAEFQNWANTIAEKNEYNVEFYPIGDEDPKHGAPSQMAVFKQSKSTH